SALVSDRASQGSGLGFDVEGILEPGTQYELTAWVKFAESHSGSIALTGQTGDSNFATLGTTTGVTGDGWTQVDVKFTLGSGDMAFIYFETPWQNGEAGD